jgi:pentatricopeptide repeat protein
MHKTPNLSKPSGEAPSKPKHSSQSKHSTLQTRFISTHKKTGKNQQNETNRQKLPTLSLLTQSTRQASTRKKGNGISVFLSPDTSLSFDTSAGGGGGSKNKNSSEFSQNRENNPKSQHFRKNTTNTLNSTPFFQTTDFNDNSKSKFVSLQKSHGGGMDSRQQRYNQNQTNQFANKKIPHGIKNQSYALSHGLNKMDGKYQSSQNYKHFNKNIDHNNHNLLLSSKNHPEKDSIIFSNTRYNDRKSSHGQTHHDLNHPLAAHLARLHSRQEKEQYLSTRIKSYNAQLRELETDLSAPIQDLLLHNYSTIQRLALKSKDSNVSQRNSHRGKGSEQVQLLENIGGAFHALEDSLQGQRGKKAVKGTILEGIAAGGDDDVDENLTGWSLPQVDGVSTQITSVYSSQPKIDPKSLPLYLQNVIFTADKKLITSQKNTTKLLQNNFDLTKLLESSTRSGEYFGQDSNGNEIKIEKIAKKQSSQTSETSLVIHGLHPTGALNVKFDDKNGQLVSMVSLKDNLPITEAFLPPNTSLSIPTELLQSGPGGSDAGIKDDTLMAVSISVKELAKRFEKTHIELHKKDYYHFIDRYGQNDGEKKFWAKFPLKKSQLMPKEADIHAKYMTLLTSQHSLIKDIVTATGYGHIQQVESREALIKTLLHQSESLDDVEMLLLLKQSNLVSNDIVDMRQLTIYEAQTGDVLTGKDALHGLLTHFQDESLSKQQKNALTDRNCSWLNSRESIILPYNSPDGFSDAHLPTLLRASLRSIESTFKSMTHSCTPSATAYTNMLSLYGQLGLPARAATLFDEMVHESDTVPDTTAYNVMLSILSRDNKTDLCIQLFDRMRQQAVDSVGFGQAEKYQSYQSVKHVEGRKVAKLKALISHKARSMGIDDVDFSGLVELVKDDPNYKGTYLQGFDEKNKPSKDLIPRPDVITYTTVLKALGKTRQKVTAMKLFDQMRKVDGIQPNELTWTTMIDIVCDSDDFLSGLRLFHEMRSSGIKPSRATYSAMTTAAARGGEIALTAALLSEMMTSQQANIQAYGLQTATNNNNNHHNGPNHSHLLIDAPFIGNIMRASAEGGHAEFALKLHTQLLKGQITGSGTIINPRNKHALVKKHLGGDDNDEKDEKDKNSTNLNSMPNAVTYNALMEVLADPASWGRTRLPPTALRIGLAVYQEALMNNIFPHPYSEVQSTGIIDLRPFTRNAVLFPIHFFLNSLLGEVPIYTVDGIVPHKLSKNVNNANNNSFQTSINSDNLDLAVSMIVNRKVPQHVLNQNPTPYSVVDGTANPSNGELIVTSSTNLPSTTWQRPQESIRFPKLTIPPKGALFICSKEVKVSWSADQKAANPKFTAESLQKYIPAIDYVENILRNTKPWLHFTRLHYGGNEHDGDRKDSGKNAKRKTANNPNAVVVSSNALRVWTTEKGREMNQGNDSRMSDNNEENIDEDGLSKRQIRKFHEQKSKEIQQPNKDAQKSPPSFSTPSSEPNRTKQTPQQSTPKRQHRINYDDLPVQHQDGQISNFNLSKKNNLEQNFGNKNLKGKQAVFSPFDDDQDDDMIAFSQTKVKRGSPKH